MAPPAESPPATRYSGSACRWPARSPTPPPRAANTSTRPAAATCMCWPTAISTPPARWRRASAAGDAVVLGTPLAECAEALGDGWFWPAAAAHPSLPRGALLQIAVGERPPLERVLNGPSDDPFGSLNLVGGLRRSMAKAGYCDLKEFQKVGLTVDS